MSKKNRRRHNAAFEFKLAMEALKGLQTTSEIAALYEVHPTQVLQWKRDLVDKASTIFEGPR